MDTPKPVTRKPKSPAGFAMVSHFNLQTVVDGVTQFLNDGFETNGPMVVTPTGTGVVLYTQALIRKAK